MYRNFPAFRVKFTQPIEIIFQFFGVKIGDIIMQGLAEALKDVAHVNDIRGSGCMIVLN